MDCVGMLYKMKLTCRGTPNEKSVQACACTVLNYMIDTMGIGNNQIILYLLHSPLNSSYGHSLGSAVSAYLAVYASKTRSRGVAGVVLQVLPSPSPHLQSCFMSIYRLVFDLRFSAKRDLYETVDIVFLSSPLLRRSRTSAAPSRSSTACATASCPCPIRRRSSRSFRRICGTSVCLWWEWVVHVRRSPPPVITTSSCFARPDPCSQTTCLISLWRWSTRLIFRPLLAYGKSRGRAFSA